MLHLGHEAAFQLCREEGVMHEHESMSEMANHFTVVLNALGEANLSAELLPATFRLLGLECSNGHSLLFDEFCKGPQLKLCSFQSLSSS